MGKFRPEFDKNPDCVIEHQVASTTAEQEAQQV